MTGHLPGGSGQLKGYSRSFQRLSKKFHGPYKIIQGRFKGFVGFREYHGRSRGVPEILRYFCDVPGGFRGSKGLQRRFRGFPRWA